MIYWEHTYMENGSIKTSETFLNPDKFRTFKQLENISINIINSNVRMLSKKYKDTPLDLNKN